MSASAGLEALIEMRLGIELSPEARLRLPAEVSTAALREAGLDAAVWRPVLDAVLVPTTRFYRHPEQLRALAQAAERERLAIWSAACSTGEEVYSLAALFGERAAEVLGTDVSVRALARAREGRYRVGRRDEWGEFPDPLDGGLEVSDEVRERVSFEVLNLVEEAYPRPRSGGGWDLIVCRNVLLYFSAEVRRQVVQRLLGALAPGGWLVLSPAEHVPRGAGAESVEGGFNAFRRATPGRPKRVEWKAPQETQREVPVKVPERMEAPVEEPVEVPEEAGVSWERHEGVARRALAEGAWGEAEAALRRVLALAPGRWEAAYTLAQLVEVSGTQAEVEAAYGRLARALDLVSMERRDARWRQAWERSRAVLEGAR